MTKTEVKRNLLQESFLETSSGKNSSIFASPFDYLFMVLFHEWISDG